MTDIFKDKTAEMPGREMSVEVPLWKGDAHDRTMQMIERRKFEEASVQHAARPRYGHSY